MSAPAPPRPTAALSTPGSTPRPGPPRRASICWGNRQMGALARELDFEFARCGSLVLCLDEADRPRLEALAVRGRQNGVPGLEILPGDEVRRREPMVSERCVAALWAPTGGIVCPFGLTIALAENACDNGVTFLPLTEVTAIARMGGGYRVETGRGALTARCVVNAAGVYAMCCTTRSAPAGCTSRRARGITACWTKRRAATCAAPSSSCRGRPARACW